MNLIQLTGADDPRLVPLSELLTSTFPDPNSVLGLDRMREFLGANEAAERQRDFLVVVAERDGRLIGGTVFSYVPRSNCAFSEYIVTERSLRGRGIGRALFDRRKELLDCEAARHGRAGCAGVFIEADNPDRTPTDLLEIERETALEARDRLRLFDHLGFRRVDVAYVQPPLAPDKQSVSYLDLLFAPWQTDIVSSGAIPTRLVLETVAPIWSAWAPESYAPHLERLRQALREPRVALVSL